MHPRLLCLPFWQLRDKHAIMGVSAAARLDDISKIQQLSDWLLLCRTASSI